MSIKKKNTVVRFSDYRPTLTALITRKLLCNIKYHPQQLLEYTVLTGLKNSVPTYYIKYSF